jgi:hypothetical protein
MVGVRHAIPLPSLAGVAWLLGLPLGLLHARLAVLFVGAFVRRCVVGNRYLEHYKVELAKKRLGKEPEPAQEAELPAAKRLKPEPAPASSTEAASNSPKAAEAPRLPKVVPGGGGGGIRPI